jgi:hypothetical protein
MSTRTAAWLAWSVCAVCVALIALALLLSFLTDELPPYVDRLSPGLAVLAGALSLVYPTVGALIVSRLPSNPIGWIFCGLGLLYAARRFALAYSDYTLFAFVPLRWPWLTEYAAWFSDYVSFPVVVLAGVFLMLLFPDGRLPSRRWRIVAWAAVFGAATNALAYGFWPGELINHPLITNPFGVEVSLGGYTTDAIFAALLLLGMTLLWASSMAALVSPILRLHRAQGYQRQQFKWFLYAAVPAVVCLTPFLLGVILFVFPTVGSGYYVLPWGILDAMLFVAGLALLILPVFTFIAILRYRLYDIDAVINRTLVYTSLTATLVAVYFAGIVVLQRLFVVLTGKRSTLAVVASTLAIAALFNPLRRRIQSFVDRRFYRNKYDARKTLEDFSAQLRNETDLEALRGDLVGVVKETMQPAHVSLWLRTLNDAGRPREPSR